MGEPVIMNVLNHQQADNDPNKQALQNCNGDCLETISCTTFNILAPIYKRLGGGARESEFRESWHSRNKRILDRLLHLKSSIICLQEFWVENEELVEMFEKRLHDAGYQTYKLARTNNRGDGLFTAVHQSQFRLLHYKELLFNDIADRVAQVLHVELCCDLRLNSTTSIVKEVMIVNTHLIFPHDSRYCFLRLQQVYKILQYLRSYIEIYALSIPVILCGDWNGSKKGHVYKFLRSQRFVSSYDIVHHYEDDSEDSQKIFLDYPWVLLMHHLLEVLEASRAYWCSQQSGSITASSMDDFIEELLHGRFVEEQLPSVVLTGYYWQASITNIIYDDVYDDGAARGISGDLLKELPCHVILDVHIATDNI